MVCYNIDNNYFRCSLRYPDEERVEIEGRIRRRAVFVEEVKQQNIGE